VSPQTQKATPRAVAEGGVRRGRGVEVLLQKPEKALPPPIVDPYDAGDRIALRAAPVLPDEATAIAAGPPLSGVPQACPPKEEGVPLIPLAAIAPTVRRFVISARPASRLLQRSENGEVHDHHP